VVRDYRSDVLVIREEELAVAERGEPGPAYARLRRRRPELQPLDPATLRQGVLRAVPSRDVLMTAFLNANGSPERPIYVERTPVAVDLLRNDWTLSPAGPLMRWEPRPPRPLDPERWRFPVEAEEIAARIRRKRGQSVTFFADRIHARPEAYEERLIIPILRARQNLATQFFRGSSPENWKRCVELLESIMRLRPGADEDVRVQFPLGMAHARLGHDREAEEILRRVLPLEMPPSARAEGAYTVGQICLRQGRSEDARRYFALARSQTEISPEIRRALEEAPR
jgi:hypothetical protein